MRKILAAVILCTSLLAACSPQARWVELQPTTKPPPLALSGFAYDASSNEAVVFGGIYADEWSDDTWIWNGEDWRKVDTPDRPPAREKTAMAYDEKRDRVVLFGGRDPNNVFGDTWEWDGKTWQFMEPAHQPPARCCHAMAYDSVQKTVLLYGGWNEKTNAFFNDTWAWDGKDWTKLEGDGVPLTAAHTMVSLSSEGKVVAVPAPESVNTWEWDGTQWSEVLSRPDPSRQDGRSAYDRINHRMIVFGGYGYGKFMDDLWIYDGGTWNQLNVPVGPQARFGHILFYDQERKSIVLFGGAGQAGVLGDTWELKLTGNISNLIIKTTPTPAAGSP